MTKYLKNWEPSPISVRTRFETVASNIIFDNSTLISNATQMEDLRRVFFHEFGHFIAHEVYKRYYGGTGTKSISISESPEHQGLFLGEAKINLSEDEKEKKLPTVETLPHYLASSSYGCIFQSYYLGQSLEECFKPNGQDDMNKWYSCLHGHQLVGYNSEFSKAETEFFEQLKESKEFGEWIKFDPNNYVIDLGEQNYQVDLDRLRQDTSSLLDSQYKLYDQLINRYKEIIKQALEDRLEKNTD
jgi:hypothetical protein